MRVSSTIENVPTRCWWASLLFCTIYNSYRYPLQINSSGTSPTYSDTPASFQLTKFIIVLLLSLIAIFFIPSKSLKFSKWLAAGFLAYLSIFPILKSFLSDHVSQVQYLEIAFWPLAALITSIATGPISVHSLNRYFRFVFIYTLISTAIEVALFLVVGRLPALAYRGSIAVRFGGFLDDPNGFPALLYMLMGWAYYRYAGWRCFIAEASLVACLLLTQSLTALIFFGLVVLLFLGYQLVCGRRRILLLILCVFMVAMLIPLLPRLVDLATSIMTLKSGSIDQHVTQNATPLSGTPIEQFLGGDTFVPYESWWIGSLHNFGLWWYSLNIVAVCIVLWQTISALFRISGNLNKAVLAGISMLSLYFVAGNSNLPFFTVFPINFIFFALSYLVLFGRITFSESEPRHSPDSPYLGQPTVTGLKS